MNNKDIEMRAKDKTYFQRQIDSIDDDLRSVIKEAESLHKSTESKLDSLAKELNKLFDKRNKVLDEAWDAGFKDDEFKLSVTGFDRPRCLDFRSEEVEDIEVRNKDSLKTAKGCQKSYDANKKKKEEYEDKVAFYLEEIRKLERYMEEAAKTAEKNNWPFKRSESTEIEVRASYNSEEEINKAYDKVWHEFKRQNARLIKLKAEIKEYDKLVKEHNELSYTVLDLENELHELEAIAKKNKWILRSEETDFESRKNSILNELTDFEERKESLLLEYRASKDTYEMALDTIESNVEDINDQGIAAMRKCADKLKYQLKQLQKIQARAKKDGLDGEFDFDRVESNIKHLISFYE